jgi:putative oxidoreductase
MTTIATTPDRVPVPGTRQAALPSWHTTSRRAAAVLRKAEPYAQSAVLLALRLLYGGLFAQSGWGKLMNFERTTGFFSSLGLPAPSFMAALVATTELTGGILLLVGVGTRLAGAALTTVMLTAYATAHAEEAFKSISAFTEQPPYPFVVATVILVAFGAGRVSIDGWLRARATRRTGTTGSKAVVD